MRDSPHLEARTHHSPEIRVPHNVANFSPEALRRLVAITQITSAQKFLELGRSVEEYRASIAMYLDRYLETGDLTTLAKAILKMVSLRAYLHD